MFNLLCFMINAIDMTPALAHKHTCACFTIVFSRVSFPTTWLMSFCSLSHFASAFIKSLSLAEVSFHDLLASVSHALSEVPGSLPQPAVFGQGLCQLPILLNTRTTHGETSSIETPSFLCVSNPICKASDGRICLNITQWPVSNLQTHLPSLFRISLFYGTVRWLEFRSFTNHNLEFFFFFFLSLLLACTLQSWLLTLTA